MTTPTPPAWHSKPRAHSTVRRLTDVDIERRPPRRKLVDLPDDWTDRLTELLGVQHEVTAWALGVRGSTYYRWRARYFAVPPVPAAIAHALLQLPAGQLDTLGAKIAAAYNIDDPIGGMRLVFHAIRKTG